MEGQLRLALVLQLEASDDIEHLGLQVKVVRGSDLTAVGQADPKAFSFHRTHPHVEGSPPYVPLDVALPTRFENPGQYAVVVQNRVDGRLAFIPFSVVTGSSAA